MDGIKIAIVLFVAFLMLFAMDLGSRPIATRGEGREVLVAKNMLEQQNFTLPLRNGREIPSKPPMFHWVAALSSLVIGQPTAFAVRFPSALAAALLLAVTYYFVSTQLTALAGLFASLILATSFEFSRSATHGRVDMCFACGMGFALISVFSIVESALSRRRYSIAAIALAIAGSVVAVLSKGPAAFVLIVGVSGLYLAALWLRKEYEIKELPLLAIATALCATLFLSGIWYWLAYVEQGAAFLQKQLWQENFTRFVQVAGETSKRGHIKPFYFSLIHLLSGFAPWSLLLPLCLVYWVSRKDKSLSAPSRFELFCGVWVLVVILAVSLSKSKRVVYLLPLYPALAALMASLFATKAEQLQELRKSFRSESVLLASLASVLLLAFAGLLYALVAGRTLSAQLPSSLSRYNEQLIFGISYLSQHLGLLPALALAISSLVVASWAAKKRNAQLMAVGVASMMLVAILIVGHWINPFLASLQDPRTLISLIEDEKNIPNEELAGYPDDSYPALFYASKPITSYSNVSQLRQRAIRYVIVTREHLARLLAKIPSAAVVWEDRSTPIRTKQQLCLVDLMPVADQAK